jgi:predicted cobalt transporter CbtA
MSDREYTRVQGVDVAATILTLAFIVVMDRLIVYLSHRGGSGLVWGLIGFGCFVVASVLAVCLCMAAARGDRMAAAARARRDREFEDIAA